MRQTEHGRISFDDASFDVVINNQVMEHVDDLETAIAEIHRVLKSGGLVVSIFPDASIWREEHTGVAFLHWFRPGRLRFSYAIMCLALGVGYRQMA